MLLRGFTIGILLRKVSDKFKDIQKIGSERKNTKARGGETEVEKEVENVVEKEEIFPSLSSLLTPEAVTGSEVKQWNMYPSNSIGSIEQAMLLLNCHNYLI